MLVTLGNNTAISAGGSVTFPYACKSLQKVFVKVDDSTGGDAYSHSVTVQLGSRTIANGISAYGVRGLAALQNNNTQSSTDFRYLLDFGCHNLLDNENVYVTIQSTSALDAVDVSALVDEPTGEMPIRYTEYSDNVFTAENVLMGLCYTASAGTAIDEDASNVEIRDAVESSAPTVISSNNWFSAESFSNAENSLYGLLKRQALPLTTTFNYPSSATINRILVAQLMGTNTRAIRQGQRAKAIARSQVGK